VYRGRLAGDSGAMKSDLGRKLDKGIFGMSAAIVTGAAGAWTSSVALARELPFAWIPAFRRSRARLLVDKEKRTTRDRLARRA
jgi:hypothetical protein